MVLLNIKIYLDKDAQNDKMGYILKLMDIYVDK